MSALLRSGIPALAILTAQAVLMAQVVPAIAAPACPQGHAVYQDRPGDFELRFLAGKPVADEAVAVSHIELVELATGASFEGEIRWNMGFAVPNVEIGHACGSDADARQCSYEAVVYSLIMDKGRPDAATDLPADSEPAAGTLLLPDLSRYWHYNARARTDAIPGEVFCFARCI